MSPLVGLALEVLDAPGVREGLRSVAGMALLTALNSGVEVPPQAPMAVWRWLLRSGRGAHLLHTHELLNAEVARDAVRILTADPDAGDDARDLATAVLRDENLAVVTDADIVLLAERVMDEGRTRRFTFLVEEVHEQRGLTPGFLKILRDRLSLATGSSARAASVDVGGLLPRLDEDFTRRMLSDASPVVRRAVLEQLERTELLDRAKAAAIVRQHLGSAERHRTVIAAGLGTLGALVKREPEGN